MTGAARNALEVLCYDTCSPQELGQRKLDRLRELRAVIDSLRDERESNDPLLAWALGQEHRPSGNP